MAARRRRRIITAMMRTAIILTAITTLTMTIAEEALFHLMSLLSPAYPVGAFAHSSGLEWAVAADWVTGRAALEDWLRVVIGEGAGWNDAVLLSAAHRASALGDRRGLAAVGELAAAAHPALERRIEALSQGEAFRRIAVATLPAGATALLHEVPEGTLAYPVAVGIVAAGQGIALALTLTGYLHALLGNLVSAGQRLIPLGQTDGQAAILALKPVVLEVVQRVLTLPAGDPFDHLGSAAILADFASIRHETQYTRLFRT
jgi:urease accessory protein